MSLAVPCVRIEIFRGPPKLFDDNWVKGWTKTSGGTSAFSTDGDVASVSSGDQTECDVEKDISFSTDTYPKIAVRIPSDSENWGVDIYYDGAWHAVWENQTETGLKEATLPAGQSVTKIRIVSEGVGKTAKFDSVAISKQSVLILVDETKSDIVESLTITRPILSRGVGGFSCKLPNEEGMYSFPPGHDSSGEDNHGTVYGATVIDGMRGGKALSFDGEDDYVQVADDPSLDITDELTVEAWINFNDIDSYKTILWKGNEYRLLLLAGPHKHKVAFYLWDGTDWEPPVFSPDPLTPNEWHHVVGVWNRNLASKELKLYVDGDLVAEVDRELTPTPTTNPVRMGKAMANYFAGIIDEVRIYNRALSSEEIRQNMKGNATTDGLVGEWKFYAGKISDFDHVFIYLWRKGATMKKVFGGKILLPGTEGFGSSGEYYLLLGGMDIGQELIVPPALLEKYYSGVNGKTIIQDAIDLCVEVTKKFVDVDNDLASTHDFEFEKVKSYDVINEVCADAKTSGGVVGFDGYVDPAGNMHIFKRDKYLSPVDLTGIIEHYKKEDDVHRVRNKIYVFGEASKPFPLNKDTWTDWTNPQTKSDLTSDASAGQKIVNVADGSIFSVGDKVLIIDNNGNEHNEIESISVNQLTMKNNLVNTYITAANAFVELLPGWYGSPGSVSADASEKIFGDRSVKLNVTGADYYGNAVFELDEPVNCNLYPSLTFQIKAESAYSGDAGIRLTDEAGMTVRKELKIRLAEWNIFQFRCGRKHSDEWTHSLFNTQDFNWEKVIRIEIFSHFSGTGTGAFWVDNLFFNHRRWSAVAEDSTSQSTRCNDPIIDDMLKSDNECQKRADGLLEFLKDKVKILKNFTVEGNNGFTPGDKQPVVISNDNIDENFRILEIRHIVRGVDWTTELTLTDEPVLVDYVFKELEKRLDRLERRAPVSSGATGEPTPAEAAEKKSLAYNKKTGIKPGTEITLVSYSVSANQTVVLHGFLAWGTCQAVYRLYVGSNVKISFATSEAFRMVPADVLREAVEGPATIQVKVLHYVPAAGIDDYHDFEGSILGRVVT